MVDQHDESQEHKRSKPRAHLEESAAVENRRIQRELMAEAAEKRMLAAKDAAKSVGIERGVEVRVSGNENEDKGASLEKVERKSGTCGVVVKDVEVVRDVEIEGSKGDCGSKGVEFAKDEDKSGFGGVELSKLEADELFLVIFGSRVNKDVLAQWTNQGIRFSSDPETYMGLVQHEGGPCGVLAAIQGFVLRHLIYSPEQSSTDVRRVHGDEYVDVDIFSSLSEEKRSRALVRSMAEILFQCGSGKRAVISSLKLFDSHLAECSRVSGDEAIAKLLEGFPVESGSDLQKLIRIDTFISPTTALQKLEALLPIFRSRMGALLFLISALLSRGLDNIQEDRDDPSQPLVTAPFGHASQEIVNLLLSGIAVANVFDGNMDLGGGMFVKGISTNMEVGFLTLLESLNYCKVGHYLKRPKWPIWVVGSESHYTVLFALHAEVQNENEFETRESQIRRAFDAQDQSGGGGFISFEGFQQVINETNINLPPAKFEHLSSMGFIVWSEFWQALLDLDMSLGGVKDSRGLMGNKVFDIYHFNGIAKSIGNGGSNQAWIPIQKPRLTKLRVSVPPRWRSDEYMAIVPVNSEGGVHDSGEVAQPTQYAPLVDCIRTRWPRANCNWDGDAPSIV